MRPTESRQSVPVLLSLLKHMPDDIKKDVMSTGFLFSMM